MLIFVINSQEMWYLILQNKCFTLLYDIESNDSAMSSGVAIGVETGCDVVRASLTITGNTSLATTDKVN